MNAPPEPRGQVTVSAPEPRDWRALRVPLSVIFLGLVQVGMGILGYRMFAAKEWGHAISPLVILAGGAAVIGGLISLVFKLAMARSFEWYIAWRYLRDRRSGRSYAPLIVGLVLAAATVGLALAASYWGRLRMEELALGPSNTQRILQGAALGIGILAYVVLFYGVLLLAFSLFTSISIFGVFLGTAALVVVLSVMGGFENDLRQKILGTTAHVVVTRPKKIFFDYRQVMGRIAGMESVIAQSPFIESEVMVTSQSNLSGVLLKGIDPRLIGKVTDLPKFLRAEEGAGRLEDLLHPERLAKIPESRFRPMVTPPLGEGPDGGGDGGVHRERDGGPPGALDGGTSRRIDGSPDERRADSGSEEAGAAYGADEPPADQRAGERRGRKQPLSILDVDVEKEIGKKIPPRPVYPGIIIGAELAKNLRLYVGDDVNVVAPLGGMSPAGPIPKSKPFRVAAIFYSGMYEFDTKFAYVTIPAAQRFLGLEDEVSGIEIKVGSLEEATPLAQRIARQYQRRGYQVEDWKDMNKSLFSALKLEKMVMFIVLTFIVLVAAFSIITNLIMVVLEKTREISALKTMGASAWSTLKIFCFAGLYIGTIGVLMGVLTGVGICLFLAEVGLPLDPEVYYISTLPVRMNPLDIALVALAAETLSFLATIYPALMAARLKAVEGLRRYEI